MKKNIEKNVDTQNTSFAKGLNFYKLFWIFYIGCFAGVVVECVWCIFKNGFFEYRTALILEPRPGIIPKMSCYDYINADVPVALNVSERVLCLPLYDSLTIDCVEKISDIILSGK